MRKIPMPEAPEGYEWVKVNPYEYDAEEGPSVSHVEVSYYGNDYTLAPKQKRYDWSKTADYVFVGDGLQLGWLTYDKWVISSEENPARIYTGWLPHFSGPCPFDPDASIVEVSFTDGQIKVCRCSEVSWGSKDCNFSVTAVRFIRLADGYTWG